MSNITSLLNSSHYIVTKSYRLSFLDIPLICVPPSPVMLLLPSLKPWSFYFRTASKTGLVASSLTLPIYSSEDSQINQSTHGFVYFFCLIKFIQNAVPALTSSESPSIRVTVHPNLPGIVPRYACGQGWGKRLGKGFQPPCGLNMFISLCQDQLPLFACSILLLPSSLRSFRKLTVSQK